MPSKFNRTKTKTTAANNLLVCTGVLSLSRGSRVPRRFFLFYYKLAVKIQSIDNVDAEHLSKKKDLCPIGIRSFFLYTMHITSLFPVPRPGFASVTVTGVVVGVGCFHDGKVGPVARG